MSLQINSAPKKSSPSKRKYTGGMHVIYTATDPKFVKQKKETEARKIRLGRIAESAQVNKTARMVFKRPDNPYYINKLEKQKDAWIAKGAALAVRIGKLREAMWANPTGVRAGPTGVGFTPNSQPRSPAVAAAIAAVNAAVSPAGAGAKRGREDFGISSPFVPPGAAAAAAMADFGGPMQPMNLAASGFN